MVEIGYKLFTENHGSHDLVNYARMAEDAGFDYVDISDHYLPWISKRGKSPFAWCVIGGLSQATESIRVHTGVTCPIVRYHPALVAQMAATAAVMLPDRFELGVGTGENLNEHVVGDSFPTSVDVRLDMLREAVEIIRSLWNGEMQDYVGNYYTVINAQIFELPDTPPPIDVSAEGSKAAKVAGAIGDGLVHFEQKPEEVIQTFRSSGGEGKPCRLEFGVCYAQDESQAKKTAYEWFPIVANKGEINWLLPTPTDFEQLQQMVTPDDVAKKLVIGPDREKYVEKIRRAVQMGYDQVTLHQAGPDQEGFIRFAEEELLPEFQRAGTAATEQAAAGSR